MEVETGGAVEQGSGEAQVDIEPMGKGQPVTAPGTLDQPLVKEEADTEKEPEAPAYVPNLKFKVMDSEHEFDPILKDVIKDAATEKKFRELYEKAYGLDYIKPKFQETKQKYQELEQYKSAVQESINDLNESYKKGDFDSFFKALNIPEDKVWQWVVDKAKLQQLPPEQRMAVEAKQAAELRARELEKSTQTRETQYQQQVIQLKQQALDIMLGRPDVQEIAQEYDSKGTGYTFRDLVVNQGQIAWHQEGKDLSVEEAVDRAKRLIGYQQAQAGKAQEQTEPQTMAQASGQKYIPVSKTAPNTKTLPNIGGKGTSPVAQKIRSIDDLKRISKEKYGA